MFNLLSLEWKKFRKNSVVSLLTLFYVLFLPAGMILLKDYDTDGLPPAVKLLVPGPETFYSFPGVWEYLGYVGNWTVFFFLGVVVIYIISAEINYKTQRQTIINGMSRKTYFSSKLMAIIAISTLATLYYSIIAIGIGIWFTDDWDVSYMFDNDWAILRFFLMSLGYLSFAGLLAILLRKSGLAIFLYMSYAIIIEPLLKALMRFKDFIPGEYANYLPLNAMEDLMPMPFYKFAEMIPGDFDFEFLLSYKSAVITSIIFVILFIVWAYNSFMKRDL